MRLLYPLGVLITVGLALARPSPSNSLLLAPPELRVPAGYTAERYATGLKRPTAMAFGPDGRLYVAQETGQIVVVGAGSAKPRVLASGFNTPLGLAWSGPRLFVSSRVRLDSLNLIGKTLRARRTLLKGLPHGRHQQDNVVVGTDGRLYLGSGSTCDVCREKDSRSATILSVRPNGRELRVVARGLRNPYGLALRPGTGRLYATVNGRDDLGTEPAEALVEVAQGRHFGWPGCWPSFARKRLAGKGCANVTPPTAYLEPRSVPAGSRSRATAARPSLRSGVSTSAGGTDARSCASRSTPTAASPDSRSSPAGSTIRLRCSSRATMRCSSRTGARGASTESPAGPRTQEGAEAPSSFGC